MGVEDGNSPPSYGRAHYGEAATRARTEGETMRRTTRITMALATSFALAACGGESTAPPETAGDGGNSPTGGTAGDGVVEIRMQNTAFVAPGGGKAVTVAVGTTIEWVNMDAVQHTATSSSVPAGGVTFDSGLMGNGDRYRFTPHVAGTWVYRCEVHPGVMRDATITATTSGSNDPNGNDPPSNPDTPTYPDYPTYTPG